MLNFENALHCILKMHSFAWGYKNPPEAHLLSFARAFGISSNYKFLVAELQRA